MGCSSSTQTHPQGGNRPPARTVETKGPKKSASELSDQIIDDIETIPDQTKLEPPTENEPSNNEIPPEEEQVEAEEDYFPVDEEPAKAEEDTGVIAGQDSSVVEGETEEAVEANNHEEIVSEEPETKEDETQDPSDAAEPELDTADAE